MKPYLVFQLFCPIFSWGDISKGENRYTKLTPSISSLIGLLSGSLGLYRSDPRILELQDKITFLTVTEAVGKPLVEFQTAQVPATNSSRNLLTRKKEIEIHDSQNKSNTILIRKEYFTDGLFTVIVKMKKGDDTEYLRTLSSFLNEPAFSPYVGRKCCPLGLPMEAQLVDANNWKEALDSSVFDSRELIRSRLNFLDSPIISWERGQEDLSVVPRSFQTRRDLILDRKNWLFLEREEIQGSFV